MSTERKEILRVNGLVIVIIMALVANGLLLGVMERWYRYRMFIVEQVHTREQRDALAEVRKEKNAVRVLEGKPNWNSTLYAKMRPETRDVETQ